MKMGIASMPRSQSTRDLNGISHRTLKKESPHIDGWHHANVQSGRSRQWYRQPPIRLDLLQNMNMTSNEQSETKRLHQQESVGAVGVPP